MVLFLKILVRTKKNLRVRVTLCVLTKQANHLNTSNKEVSTSKMQLMKKAKRPKCLTTSEKVRQDTRHNGVSLHFR